MKDGETYNPFQLFDGLFIPEWLACSKQISAGAKLAFGRLARYAGKNGLAYPAVETLAEQIGYGVRQTQYFLTELQTAGLIRKVARVSEIGQSSNLYEFVWHKEMMSGVSPGARECTPGVQGSAPTPVHCSAPKESHIEESQLKRRQGALPGLEEWPYTAAAAARYFEAEGTLSVRKFIEDSVSAMINKNYIPDEKTDYHLAGLVGDAVKANPKARWPAFKQNVANIIENRLKQWG